MTQQPPTSNLIGVPFPAEPGTFGVCHGSGIVADVIRHATESWAGHAVMYVGNKQVVEARYPKVVLDAAPADNVVWATKQPLTPAQRVTIVSAARELVGASYDISVYPVLAAAVFYAAATKVVDERAKQSQVGDCPNALLT